MSAETPFMTTLPPILTAASIAPCRPAASSPRGTGMPYAAKTDFDSHSSKAVLPSAAAWVMSRDASLRAESLVDAGMTFFEPPYVRKFWSIWYGIIPFQSSTAALAAALGGSCEESAAEYPARASASDIHTVQRSAYIPWCDVSMKMLPRLSTSTSSVVARFGPGKRSPAALLNSHFWGSGGMK